MTTDIALALVKAREATGYTQRDAAQLLSVAPSLLSRIETGERMPSLPLAVGFAFLYDTRFEHLFADLTENTRAELAAQLQIFTEGESRVSPPSLRSQSLQSLQERLDTINFSYDEPA